VAHVQHSYAFFGGMHPLRSGWGAVAGAVRRPLLVTVHELDRRATGSYHLPPSLELAYKRWFNRKTFAHPAIGRWMVHAADLRDALAGLGIPPERITYRPLPIEEAPPTPPISAELRRRLGVEGKRVLVILGFLARRKGYDLALRALRELPEDYVLVAAGGAHAADRTAPEEWLRAEAATAGVESRLRVTGYLSAGELEQVTALAEMVLAPFREMSASASLSYALARAKPVIASDLPEIRGMEGVRLFPAGEAAALTQAVRELAASPARRASLAREATAYAKKHSYRTLAEETSALYSQLLEQGACLP
jgi:glycosyltransferase involved in cell wall biosynthesis